MGYKFSNIKKVNPIEAPCKKTIYYSFEEAQDMVLYIRENRSVKEINVYKCNSCGFWHLTSKQGSKS
jgi:predicted RNA-binding Zn-ribbon protein involved in translation (DUF1610 family)